jgi:site-specific DNA-cytosine methylase
MSTSSTPHVFSALFPFAGLGAGARGFLQAAARLGKDEARFLNLGGIDIDPLACADFEYLTGVKALCADINEVTPEQLRAYTRGIRPDCVFSSPPCKGLSRLLSTKAAKTEKYEKLNRLVLQGMFLILETWKDDPPPTVVTENVPAIQSRGALFLEQVRSLLRSYGYVFDEQTHNCGEIGGLAQNRIRYLMVARRPQVIPAFIYKPPRLRVRGCGEVLGTLPLPETPEAGALHRMPSLSLLNFLRLALIPAGGDWRDLPASIPEVLLAQTAANAASFKGRPGLFEVGAWDEPTRAVNGSATVSGSTGTAAVADPRLPAELLTPLKPGQERREVFAKYDVRAWDQPARTVAGSGTNGGFAVADPRVDLDYEPRRGTFGVTAWTDPSPTVRGVSTVRNGPAAVADPRLALGDRTRGGALGVLAWDQPAPTITGSMEAARSNTPASVADPRVQIALPSNPNRHEAKYRVTPWDEPAHAVTGSRPVTSGGPSVADPRLCCAPRAGAYGVLSWQEAAATVTGHARIDNGRFAVADPRKPIRTGLIPVIIAADGTWHRPITRLELAVLQGLPARVDGKPLRLATMQSIGRKGEKAPSSTTERIGNAVPVGSARAIGESILTALLAARLGTWMLSAEAIWVRRDGLDETTASSPWLAEDLAREDRRFAAECW